MEDCSRVKALAACVNARDPPPRGDSAAFSRLAALFGRTQQQAPPAHHPQQQPAGAYLVQGSDSATGQDVALLTTIQPSEQLGRAEGAAYAPVNGSACFVPGDAVGGGGVNGSSSRPQRARTAYGGGGGGGGDFKAGPVAVSKSLYAAYHNLSAALPKVRVAARRPLASAAPGTSCAAARGRWGLPVRRLAWALHPAGVVS